MLDNHVKYINIEQNSIQRSPSVPKVCWPMPPLIKMPTVEEHPVSGNKRYLVRSYGRHKQLTILKAQVTGAMSLTRGSTFPSRFGVASYVWT